MITSARSLDGLVWPRNPLVQQLVEADPLLPLAPAQAPLGGVSPHRHGRGRLWRGRRLACRYEASVRHRPSVFIPFWMVAG
jgi:hypothetical protein